ncbi:MAG: hypothetical protein J6I30_20990, partial [Pseudomonas sp.]|nr:hypothetical protein [Pseudomonas sp.]
VQQKKDGLAHQALDASWWQQNQASGFLTSGGADGSILALAVHHWQGEQHGKARPPMFRGQKCAATAIVLQKATEPPERA